MYQALTQYISILCLLTVTSFIFAADNNGGIAQCLGLSEERAACYASLCEYEPGYLCAENVLDAATETAGPERAMQVLHEIMTSPLFSIKSDGHLLSHVIGRATSRVFGSSGEHFLRCPHDFNDGCYHGFFEDTLRKVPDPVSVATSICEGMPLEETSQKARAYCYHGAGHVFLMNTSYDLDVAISQCSSIPGNWSESCLGGVFMENAWPARNWEEKRKNFRVDDPLYPCNAVEDGFRPICYMEHYSYLMQEHTESFNELVEICLKADEHAGSCLGGIGNMLQNSQRTDAVAESFNITDKTYMEKILFLCAQFPEGYEASCYAPLAGALLNFDFPSMERISVFCSGIEEAHRSACFRHVGSYLPSLGNSETGMRACMTLPEAYQDDCLYTNHEANQQTEAAEQTAMNRKERHTLLEKIQALFALLSNYITDIIMQSIPVQKAEPSASESAQLPLSGIKKCLSQENERAACYTSLCTYDPGYLCAEEILNEVTKQSDLGPEAGMYMLQDMVKSELFNLTVGDTAHALAHVIGRATARHIGIDGTAFLRCPTTFDYGCVHGFLEVALPESASPSAKINEVCESLPEKPTIGRPNCYHGSGHGVMMNESYNLPKALAICDGLLDAESCWGGVFMENVDGRWRIFELYPEHNTFSENNPHAPCDAVEEKYRQTCYRVHAPYLAQFFEYDVEQVVATCLNAGTHTEDCVFGFGWHVLFEGLQNALNPDPTMSMVEKTIYLCNQFPEQYRNICYRPAVNQITVSHGTDRSFEFCEKIEEKYRHNCYREVGSRLDNLVTSPEEKENKCAVLPEIYRNNCLNGWEGNYPHARQQAQPEKNSPLLKNIIGLFAQNVSAEENGGYRPAKKLIAIDEYAHATIRSKVESCLNIPKGSERNRCYLSLCGTMEPGYICAEHIIYEVTRADGVIAGITAIQEISDIPAFNLTGDNVFGQHQLAHIVGRSASRNHGKTGEVFIRCPRTFDYGCHHGFFEAALQEAQSPADALLAICTPDAETTQNETANCYHGGGHGVMMNASYNLDEALAVCDMLPNQRNVGNCYGGMFMESGKGFIEGRVPEENDRYYHKHDLLAPCSNLEQKYHNACYSSHFMYYVQYVADISVKNLVAECRKAGDSFGLCISGASRLFIEGVQDSVLRASDTAVPGDVIEKTIFLCNQLPDGYIRPCHTFLVSYYMDDLDSRPERLEKAVRYCTILDKVYKTDCFDTVNARLNDFAVNNEQKIRLCASIPAEYRDACLANVPNQYVHENSSDESERKNEESFFMRLKQLILYIIGL